MIGDAWLWLGTTEGAVVWTMGCLVLGGALLAWVES